MRSPLDGALGLLVAVAATVTALEVVGEIATAPGYAPGTVAYAVAGLAFVAVGAALWRRRPGNRTGALLAFTGIAALVAGAQNLPWQAIVIPTTILGEAPIAALLQLLLGFPSGRPRTALARWMVVAGYGATIGLQVPSYVFGPTSLGTAAHVAGHPGLAQATLYVQRGAKGAILLLTAAILWGEVRRGGRTTRERRVLAVLFAYGTAVLLFFFVTASIVGPLTHLSAYAVFVLEVVVFATMPFVVVAGLLVGGFQQVGAIDDLAGWPGADGIDAPLGDALAAALGDPTLELVVVGADGHALDASGRAVDLDAVRPPRALAAISGAGGTVGYLVVDAEMVGDGSQVAAAARIAAAALERERLTADLLAERDAARDSAARLVAASDRERRRVACDLHDLLQSRLVLAALHADRLAAELPPDTPSPTTPALPTSARGSAEQRTPAQRTTAQRTTIQRTSAQRTVALLAEDLDVAMTALRGQLQQLMPSLLLERGLAAAVADLVDRSPLPIVLDAGEGIEPMPPEVASTAYFLVVESLTNVAKHAGGQRVEVDLRRDGACLRITVRDDGCGGASASRGSGLRGMADRVRALDGSLSVLSPPGGGTTIGVELPCGW